MSVVDLTRLIDSAKRFERPDTGLRLTWPKDYGPATAPQTIVAGVLERGTLAAIFGPSNTGKSTLALDIGLAIAREAPWRDRRTHGGLVVYLGLESVAGLRRRVQAYQKRHELTPVANFCDISEAVQLLSANDVGRVLEAVAKAETVAGARCAVLIVDTLARAMGGGDENDGRDMGAIVAACDRIRHETGATVLIVHHSGKDTAKGARGHSSLRAALDTEIEVSGDANPRQAKVTKQRDLPSGDTFAFDLEAVEIGSDPETDEPITACVVVHRYDVAPVHKAPGGPATIALLRALTNRQAEASGPLVWTLDEMRRIGRDLGQHKSTARDAVARLTTGGLLVPTVGGHRLADGIQ